MDFAKSMLALFESGIAPVLLVAAALWKADSLLLSSSGAKVLYRAIENTAKSPERSEIAKYINNFLEGYFSLGNGFLKFSFNVFIFTVASLLVMLSIYTFKTTGLFDQLLSEGFLVQFIGNGFIVTYLVNFFVFAYYPIVIEKVALNNTSRSIWVLAVDILAKISLFILLTTITYVFFADFYGSFSGDKIKAISAVPSTLLLAVQFGNLTAVYFYSVVISSFPIFVVIMINMMAANPQLSKTIR